MRDAIREAVQILGDASENAEHLAKAGRTMSAAATLAEGVRDAVTALAPYARQMPTSYPHVLLVLSNGSTLRTVQNLTGEIAGLINAGEAEIYAVEDTEGVTHNLRVSAILDFYEVTAP